MPTSTPSTTPSEPSILKQLEETVLLAEKLERENKINKGVMVQIAARIRNSLRPLYGTDSLAIQSLSSWVKDAINSTDIDAIFKKYLNGAKGCLRILRVLEDSPSLSPISTPSLPPVTKNVFVIHGHDEMNLHRLKNMLRDEFKLNPIAILESAGLSRAIIDKFENHAQTCSYAIALYTPDDNVTTLQGQQFDQARPNVIFETGWFVGRLGMQRVLLLLKNGTRIHSDLEGLNRIQFNDNVSDKFLEIKRELSAAGII